MNRVSNHIKEKFENYSKNTFIKNIFFLVSGTIGAQIISFGLTPIITRIYSPDEYGVLAIFTTTITLLSPIYTLRYAVAIPLPNNDRLAYNLFMLCLFFTALISLSILLIFTLFSNSIFTFIGVPELNNYKYYFPLSFFVIGIFEVFSFWVIREKNFKLFAKTKVKQSVIGNFVKILLGILNYKSGGLIIGQIFMHSTGTLILLYNFVSKVIKNLKYINYNKILFLIQYYSSFPKYQIFSKFILALSIQAPLLFMVKIYDSNITGQLALALTVIAIPMQLLGYSVGETFYSEISKIGIKKNQQILSLTQKVTKKMFLFSLVPFITLLFFGPFLFVNIFGAEWSEAGVFSSVLSLSLMSQFVASPIANILSVFRKENYSLYLNSLRLLLISIVFIYGYFNVMDPVTLILFYSIILTIHHYIVYKVIIKLIQNN